MKQKFLLITSLVVMQFSAMAQTSASSKSKSDFSPVFSKSDKVVSASIGFGGGLGLPITVSGEYGITDNIGVGATLGYARYDYAIIAGAINNILIGARGNYHYQFVDKLDTYAGLTVGYNVASYTGSGAILPGASFGGVFAGGTVGGRYYFSKNLAAQAELGYGIAYLNVGIAYKL
jgi:hypothetical protein